MQSVLSHLQCVAWQQMKVTYLSQQFLKGFSDLYQSNVMEEVGHKSGVQQVENSCRLGGRGGGDI